MKPNDTKHAKKEIRNWFGHVGYNEPNRPDTLEVELLKLIWIQATVIRKVGDRSYHCEGGLLEPTIFHLDGNYFE